MAISPKYHVSKFLELFDFCEKDLKKMPIIQKNYSEKA